ncbi:hypothetical protein [Xenorhabdus sp. KJ12.1]|uniref:hypothetical protein n=1 Tax=Xenorhabdus sp. KJ12.1 TaxID=1851571 RepID=UPI000C051D67|nr:hypothetical protein [Xenorhabdus sp. KJ12.1]PHM72202.1 hypothetical protein Xekj_00480 [Xenorhabdus sp. KJ12.1]
MNYESLTFEGVINSREYIIPDERKCPSCGSTANYRFYYSCYNGGLNEKKSIDCPVCNYHSCGDDGCRICENKFDEEAGLEIARFYEITSRIDAHIFLATILTDLMVILAHVKIGDLSVAMLNSIAMLDEIHSCADKVINFDRTEYANLPLSKEIIISISSILHELNDRIHWSDSY